MSSVCFLNLNVNCFAFMFVASQLPAWCYLLYAQIQSDASGHIKCAHTLLKLIIKQWMICPEMTLDTEQVYI